MIFVTLSVNLAHFLSVLTVTRPYVIFSYPDRVPLTHFIHRAKKFLACGPEFSVEFSAPPEFSGRVTEKFLSTGWAQPSTFRLGSRYSILFNNLFTKNEHFYHPIHHNHFF